MSRIAIGLLLCHMICHVTVTSAGKNVLFLMADDLRPDLHAYSQLVPEVRTNDVSETFVTPNLDILASQSLLLTRAYNQYPVCGPSRASILTSRYSDTIKVHSLSDDPRGANSDIYTLPQVFREANYAVHGFGKIFHSDSLENNYGKSWDSFNRPSDEWARISESWKAITPGQRRRKPLVDDLIRDEVIAKLTQLEPAAKAGTQNFFLAAGFKKPHLPWVFPEEFLNNNYVTANIELPANRDAPVNFPDIAFSRCGELCSAADVQALVQAGDYDCSNFTNYQMPDTEVQKLRAAYYASVTYIDSLIGEVLAHLDNLGLSDDTIVLFMSDHGWQLSDHNGWCKTTNFEDSLRIPLMLRVPGSTDAGLVSHKLVEGLDVMPTVIEAAGLPVLPSCPSVDSINTDMCSEGESFLPLINNVDEPNWRQYSYSQVSRDGNKIMGYSVTDGEYRFNVWSEFNKKGRKPKFEANIAGYDDLGRSELYNLANDQYQTVNLIGPIATEPADITTKKTTYYGAITTKFG